MKAQYQAIIDQIEEQAPIWQDRLRLGEWEIEHIFLDSYYGDETADDFKVTAVCEARHQYFMAKVKWFLPSATRHTPEHLEKTLVHEDCHILLAHEQSVVDRLTLIGGNEADTLIEIYAELRETSTELACRALWKAWGPALTPALRAA